jgi:1,4-dihydroxy-2-naphthoate octaprenyltransferase
MELHLLYLRLTTDDLKKSAPKVMIIVAIIYMIWSICGLFTTIWLQFLALMLIGHVVANIKKEHAKDGKKEPNKTRFMRFVYILDAAFTIALLLDILYLKTNLFNF